jgi:phosphate transport system substrate-binding protein
VRRTHSPRIVLLLALVTPLAVLLAGCAGSPAGRSEPVTLRIAGSSSMKPLLEELTQAYQASRSNVLFEIRGGGSTLGIEDLRAGRADIAAVSWKTEDEPDPSGVQAMPIARDGIVIIVHPSNRTPGLTLLQLRALYRGETLDWKELGGSSGEPLVISREDGSGDRQAFESLVMGDDRVTLNALIMPTAEAMADYVARHPAAVGYVSLAQIREDVRVLPVEDVLPTAGLVRAGAYHLGRLLYLYVQSSPSGDVRDFLDFVLSPAGQAIVARHHAALK